MNAGDLCPAHRHDRPEERVVCVRVPDHPPGAWGFICWGCWKAMLDGKARREEWEVYQREA